MQAEGSLLPESLIEEKKGGGKNKKFTVDIKTLLIFKHTQLERTVLLGSFLHGDQYPFISALISKRKSDETQSQLIENTSSEVEFSHWSSACTCNKIVQVKMKPIKVKSSRVAEAAYESLCVVQGLMNIYNILEYTTFKWDSCAAHAILRAMDGAMRFKRMLGKKSRDRI
ncbi:hypothetical protein GH733_005798 [Mirounga leonina]|nr:hypothetical protein GH733_005798 [Mirounga leonina]